ncbi:MAG: DUF1885 family protein [Paenibacillaceae bacterium]|jgi:hypothetical protein|nr:DUF1885 family protein [Paenibacillaceae bacterium]
MPALATITVPQHRTLQDVIDTLHRYVDQVRRTGAQLQWEYAAAAFPYTLCTPEEGANRWCWLRGNNDLYRTIVFGVRDGTTIEIVLPDGHTHGDKAKANELCKYMLKQFGGTLQLFNGRTMSS